MRYSQGPAAANSTKTQHFARHTFTTAHTRSSMLNTMLDHNGAAGRSDIQLATGLLCHWLFFTAETYFG